MITPKAQERILAALSAEHAAQPASAAFEALYSEIDHGHVFAVIHEQLNEHFNSINDRARTPQRYYWAEASRQFIALIDTIETTLRSLERAGATATLIDTYTNALQACAPWLASTNGSTIPEDFAPVTLIKHEPVFLGTDDALRVTLDAQRTEQQLTLVGTGSYAHVYAYIDDLYDTTVAIKRAKKDISERDLARFKREFEILKGLSFPYVVQVYRYDEEKNQYSMEYCEETLRSFINKNNQDLKQPTRKRIALQFLYGLNYIHGKRILHRDLSLQNVLIKTFDRGAALVKLSDFGLIKDLDSQFTMTRTEMRGTIRDPQLASMKDFAVVNDIYSAGWLLRFIFTGKSSLEHSDDEVGQIVRKCTDQDTAKRYRNVLEVIEDVEKLAAPPAAGGSA
ncbi:protein kinase-like protein [Antricoccus suffuscus]|uniref:Protein kinase-like protein n=1 Tax=Antricoccus suffuscus TaxID=1629062 RepID=A0A2T0ZX24_9ACTN|nr:protein kinase family protein [Antricoccus suffuscus]PRZ40901.1 protein kinase-like protein [Antricoccus suffuscus]